MKKQYYLWILLCLTITLGTSLNAQTIFEDGFETGSFKPEWTPTPGASNALLGVRDYAEAFGNYGVAMGKTSDAGGFNTNTLDLNLDLSGYTEVEMTFWISDDADETHPEDGIYFSDDGGVTFVKVYDFDPAGWVNTAYGRLPALNVKQLAIDNDLTLTNQFVIRFQQYDDHDFFWGGSGEDGFYLDEVKVYVPATTYATLPFEDGFESGTLGNNWTQAHAFLKGNTAPFNTVRPGGFVFVDEGSYQSVSDVSAFGTYGLLMGRFVDGALTTNALDLHLNLAGQTQVEMSFWMFDYEDETHPLDGIYFSDNGGESFVKVYDFDFINWSNTWGKLPPFDIDQLALDNGLSLTSEFIIRFQQYDDHDFFWGGSGEDGLLLDEVKVYVPTTTYATLPFEDGFESATLGNNWTQAHAFLKGNTSEFGNVKPGGRVFVDDGSFESVSDVSFSGSYGLLMGRATDGQMTTNALDLHLNLAGQTQVEMSFWMYDFYDETHPQDGIYFSDNGGDTFVKVYDFEPASWSNNWGKLPPLDVDYLATSNGLSLTNQFIIRFQQHDNGDFRRFNTEEDGLLLDEIKVYVPTTTYATLPFEDGFESGILGENWTQAHAFLKGNTAPLNSIRPENILFIDDGSYQSVSDVSAFGTYGLLMGRVSDGALTTNALDLHLNLAGQTQVEMSFWMYDFADETHPLDGIYFSDNGGDTFVKVYDFDFTNWVNGWGKLPPLDVDQLAISNGLSLTNQFIIRFQQYDDADFSLTNDEDGLLLDEVKVYVPATTYATLPFEDGFEGATLGNNWTQANAFLKGNTAAENTIDPGGRVLVVSSYQNLTDASFSGQYGLILGRALDGNLTTNAADLHLDLSGQNEVELTFRLRDFTDETHIQDGIYLSDDGGANFVKVFDFDPSNTANSWFEYSLSISQLAADNGLTLTNQFIIRFQQYDDSNFDFGGDEDGFVLDDVKVESTSIPEMNITQETTTIASEGDYDFGVFTVQESSGDITFTIENTGSGDLNLTGNPKIAIGGQHANDFTVTETLPNTIAAGATATFSIRFTPSGIGVRTAQISIANNDADENPYLINLQGTGNAPEINLKQGANNLVSGTVYNFGSFATNESSGSIVFTIENTGNATLNLTGNPIVSISGTHAGDFTVTESLPNSLAAGTSATFTIVFTPSSTGTRTAQISIANNDSDENPYIINLTGTGTAPLVPEINLKQGNTSIASTGTHDFGAFTVNQSSGNITFTIENTGTAALNLIGNPKIVKTGTHASDFAIIESLPNSINSNASATFTISFTPSGAGTRTAQISIANNDSDENPYIINLTGTGENAAPQDQTITFDCPPTVFAFNSNNNQIVLGAATSSSGLPVTFSITTVPASGVATISGNTITVQAAGTITLKANVAGNASFNPAEITCSAIQVGLATALFDEDLAQATKVLPNPSNGYFTVRVHASYQENLDYQIYDANGSTLQTGSLEKFNGYQEALIDLRRSSEGIYFLQITTKEGKSIVKRLVKQ